MPLLVISLALDRKHDGALGRDVCSPNLLYHLGVRSDLFSTSPSCSRSEKIVLEATVEEGMSEIQSDLHARTFYAR